jgi:hypothetical protein
MGSQKIMRCEIRRRGATGPATERFVPLEIFGLWEYLMTHKHDFEVLEPRASLWLDMEDSPDSAYGEAQFERVTEVTAFVYSERDGMFTRARRYFRSDRCEELKRIFLSHYQHEGDRLQTHLRERPGIWLHREDAPAEIEPAR